MCATSTQVVGQCLLDLLVGGMSIGSYQCRGLHDHPVDTITALHGLFVDERLLQRMGFIWRTETLERDDVTAGDAGDWKDARAYCIAVEMHGAGSALAEPAPEPGPVQAKVIS